MCKFWLLSFVMLILLPADLWSQAVTPIPQRDPTAIALITQSLTAMGIVASPAIETLAQGTMTHANGQVEPIKLETIGTDRFRCDLGGGAFSFVSNAGAGFLIMQGQRQTLRSWVTQYKRPDHLPALSLMSDYQNLNLQVQYIGLENVNGLPAHHLRLSMVPTDGTPAQIEDLISEFHVYIDQTSLLVVKTRTFNFSPEALQNRSPVDTYFSDYQQQGTSLVPFRLTRYLSGNKDSDIVFTSVSLTANIPDSDFQ